MKKISLLSITFLLISCASQSDKVQTEYFKDFQAQVLSLSQRMEILETKIKRDASAKSEVTEKIEKIEERLLNIDKDINKIKTHPLFEGLESVKLTQVPSSTVITIRPETASKGGEAVKQITATPKEEAKVKETPAVDTTEKKEVQKPEQVEVPKKTENPIIDLYNKGYDMYTAGKFPQAISIFREFLQKYPKDALADNAQYWIAESYYAQKMFDKAISEFKKVENYPDGNKVPDAYLKIVYSYTELGKKKEAAKWKDLLLRKFKDSEAAKKVQEKSAH